MADQQSLAISLVRKSAGTTAFGLFMPPMAVTQIIINPNHTPNGQSRNRGFFMLDGPTCNGKFYRMDSFICIVLAASTDLLQDTLNTGEECATEFRQRLLGPINPRSRQADRHPPAPHCARALTPAQYVSSADRPASRQATSIAPAPAGCLQTCFIPPAAPPCAILRTGLVHSAYPIAAI